MVGEYSVRGGILDVFSPEVAEARPHRSVRRPGRIHPPLRRGIAALRPQGRRVHPAAAHRISEIARPAGRTERAACANPAFPAATSAARRNLPRLGALAPMVRAAQSLCLLLCSTTPIVALGRAGSDPRRRRPSLEAPGTDRTLRRLRSRPHLLPLGRDRAQAARASPALASRNWRSAGPHRSGRSHADLHIATRPSMAFHGNMQVAIAEARTLVEAGNRCLLRFFYRRSRARRRHPQRVRRSLPARPRADRVHARLPGRARLHGRLRRQHLPDRGEVRRGTVFPDSDSSFSAPRTSSKPPNWSPAARAPSPRSATFSADLIDLKPGDYVVHAEHGVAQYLGLREIAQGETKGDYMLLEYAGGSQALRSADPHGPGPALPRRRRSQARARPHGRRHLDPHQDPHQGQDARHGGRASQALRRSARWPKASPSPPTATGSASSRMPSNSPRPATSSPPSRTSSATWRARSPWIACSAATSAYGKTEVVMRAAFKALGDGKQVVVLAPTTVLSISAF